MRSIFQGGHSGDPRGSTRGACGHCVPTLNSYRRPLIARQGALDLAPPFSGILSLAYQRRPRRMPPVTRLRDTQCPAGRREISSPSNS